METLANQMSRAREMSLAACTAPDACMHHRRKFLRRLAFVSWVSPAAKSSSCCEQNACRDHDEDVGIEQALQG